MAMFGADAEEMPDVEAMFGVDADEMADVEAVEAVDALLADEPYAVTGGWLALLSSFFTARAEVGAVRGDFGIGCGFRMKDALRLLIGGTLLAELLPEDMAFGGPDCSASVGTRLDIRMFACAVPLACSPRPGLAGSDAGSGEACGVLASGGDALSEDGFAGACARG